MSVFNVIKNNPLSSLKWIGTSLILVSAFLLATNSSVSKYGYISYILGGIILVYVARKEKDYPYFVLNCFFIITDLIGIYTWIL